MDNNYKGKKVLIMGLGLNQGGVGSARFFANLGAEVLVTDIKTPNQLKPSLDQLKGFSNIKYTLGEHRYEDIDWSEIVIRNPALNPDNPYRVYAKKAGKRVELDIGILLEYAKPSQIIGITGAKGKSTTSTLIYEVLKASGQEVLFGGNIGKSVLDAVPQLNEKSLLVLELSSFQLEAFEEHHTAPHISLVTNILPDHLNYYKTTENYTQAKKVIALYQTPEDFLALNADDPTLNSKSFLTGLKGQIIHYSPKDLPGDFTPNLLGQHNLYNISAALAVAKILNLGKQKSLAVLENFKGVEYRLQLIKQSKEARIYNDSAATNPSATIEALKSISNPILICGGVNKELDYKPLAQNIAMGVKWLYLIEGSAADELEAQLHKTNFDFTKLKGRYSDLEKLLQDLFTNLSPSDTILFSPAAASFNLFSNEFDRGRKFNEAVEKVFK